jgi:hypothetical protein
MHAIAQPDPLQQVGDILLVVGDALAGHAQRHRHVLPRRHVVEQAEVLEDDADAAAQLGALGGSDAANVLTQDEHLSACRGHRHEQQAQQRGLAGARRAGQEVERTRPQVKGDVRSTSVPRGYFKPMACSLITVYRGLRPERATRPVSALMGNVMHRSGLWRTDVSARVYSVGLWIR